VQVPPIGVSINLSPELLAFLPGACGALFCSFSNRRKDDQSFRGEMLLIPSLVRTGKLVKRPHINSRTLKSMKKVLKLPLVTQVT